MPTPVTLRKDSSVSFKIAALAVATSSAVTLFSSRSSTKEISVFSISLVSLSLLP